MMPQINWRSTLTFDDGQSLASGVEKSEGSGSTQYTLKDITPETIPAVRNLISDVMLDIPYYLSHHKPKMIQAVIKEANRVYRLWCRNNPGFEKTGKVHLIAHSLGSVMALDILSKQPTRLPQQPDLRGKRVRDNMFEFDTKNLFLCGSPAGFFLLLNKGNLRPRLIPPHSIPRLCANLNLVTATLIPRKGREKAGLDDEIIGDGVAGDVGTYGCLAVDNIYNIMHYNDRESTPPNPPPPTLPTLSLDQTRPDQTSQTNPPSASNRLPPQRRRRHGLRRLPPPRHRPLPRQNPLPIPHHPLPPLLTILRQRQQTPPLPHVPNRPPHPDQTALHHRAGNARLRPRAAGRDAHVPPQR